MPNPSTERATTATVDPPRRAAEVLIAMLLLLAGYVVAAGDPIVTDPGTYSPATTIVSGGLVSSNGGSFPPFTGIDIAQFIGADTFYAAGYAGGNAVVVNIEGGHVWNGHESLGHVTQQFNGSDGPQIGEFDRHATWVGHAIGGRNPAGSSAAFERGIAYGATMWSGAVAAP